MKTTILYAVFIFMILSACNNGKPSEKNNNQTEELNTLLFQNGCPEVNGIRMYYEIYGKGSPLVLLHGGGSTIQTTFGRIIPLLSRNRQLICIELQAHGRTGDRDTPISFEQDADDVATLLKNLKINKADIFGFSNGGITALRLVIRHPEICNKIIAGSVLLKRNGTPPQFWKFMKQASFEQMPVQYKEAFIEVNPDSAKLINMHQKCVDRMVNFKDFSDEELKSIHVPVLIINGSHDVASSEHIVAMAKLIPNCTSVIIPGGHGEYIGEITTFKPGNKGSDFITPIIEYFIDKSER